RVPSGHSVCFGLVHPYLGNDSFLHGTAISFLGPGSRKMYPPSVGKFPATQKAAPTPCSIPHQRDRMDSLRGPGRKVRCSPSSPVGQQNEPSPKGIGVHFHPAVLIRGEIIVIRPFFIGCGKQVGGFVA